MRQRRPPARLGQEDTDAKKLRLLPLLCKGLNYRDTHCLTSSIYLRVSPILFLQPFERFQALLFYDFTHPLPLYISPYLCHQAAVFRYLYSSGRRPGML